MLLGRHLSLILFLALVLVSVVLVIGLLKTLQVFLLLLSVARLLGSEFRVEFGLGLLGLFNLFLLDFFVLLEHLFHASGVAVLLVFL